MAARISLTYIDGFEMPNYCVKRPQAKAQGQIFGATSPQRPYHDLYSRLWESILDCPITVGCHGNVGLTIHIRFKVWLFVTNSAL